MATFYITNSRINVHEKEILWDHSTLGGQIFKGALGGDGGTLTPTGASQYWGGECSATE